jgi:hypothetical protein
MKFIILVCNLKEISPSVFSWKKKIYKKNYDAILSKYDSAVESVNIFIYNMCFFQKAISHMRKRFTEWGHCVGHQWSYDHIHEYMNIMLVNIEFFMGDKKSNSDIVPSFQVKYVWYYEKFQLQLV